MNSPQAISAFFTTPFKYRQVPKSIAIFLFANQMLHNKMGVSKAAAYRMVLWLLRENINEDDVQNIVRACIKQLLDKPNSSLEFQIHRSNQFMSFQQLITATQIVLRAQINKDIQEPALKYRSELLAILDKDSCYYTTETAQFLLAISDIRNQLSLHVNANPFFIDTILLSTAGISSKQPQRLNPMRGVFDELKAQEFIRLLAGNASNSEKPSVTKKTHPLERIVVQDKLAILHALKVIPLASENIKLAVNRAQLRYSQWHYGLSHRKLNGFFSNKGQQASLSLKQLIEKEGMTYDIMITVINQFLKAPNRSFQCHSFAAFLLNELTKLKLLPWSAIQYDKVSMLYNKSSVLSKLNQDYNLFDNSNLSFT